ncbi:MAG: response regulator transcription factor [Bacteroidia bacterium]
MQNTAAHILFVEDDINLSFVTCDNLEKQGYKITSSQNGIDAWETYKQGEFDLCILDVMLPGNDGFSLAKQIREKDRQIPILFLTAKSLKEDRIEGLRNGGDDYITKPFSIEELILRIEIFLKRRFISSHNEKNTNTFTLGNSTFDHANLLLKNASQSFQLTQKEADLLAYLCQHPNMVLKREEILRSLWGDDDYFLGRSLDVFISRLRKYLQNEPNVNINNVHGVGFRMDVSQSMN